MLDTRWSELERTNPTRDPHRDQQEEDPKTTEKGEDEKRKWPKREDDIFVDLGDRVDIPDEPTPM